MEVQNTYFRELANISKIITRILNSESLNSIKKALSRAYTRQDVSNLQNYQKIISQQEEEEKNKLKENIRERLC